MNYVYDCFVYKFINFLVMSPLHDLIKILSIFLIPIIPITELVKNTSSESNILSNEIFLHLHSMPNLLEFLITQFLVTPGNIPHSIVGVYKIPFLKEKILHLVVSAMFPFVFSKMASSKPKREASLPMS